MSPLWPIAALALVAPAFAHDNGLARTPQMGWNTWNHYGCGISESLILESARALVDSGLKDVGYEYVLIDDCWQAPERHPKTKAPVADPNKFPHGIRWLSRKVHDLGLKLGIYSDAGSKTCAGFYGSLDMEDIDAKQYAEWEVDYLKYDNCYNEGRSGTPLISRQRFGAMSDALNATGRPILFSMCNWGEDQPWNWAQTVANSWRISGDIHDSFKRFDERCPCESVLDCKFAGYHCAVARIIDFAAAVGQKGGAGHWNDLDMLEIGNGGMTYDEYVTHFSMWAILKSPLILGNDLSDMSDETFSIISNEALIAISKDRQGSSANRMWKRKLENGGDLQLWVGWLSEWETVVAVMNTGDETIEFDVPIADVFLDGSEHSRKAPYYLYDLWEKEDGFNASVVRKDKRRYGRYEGIIKGHITKAQIRPHQTRVWKLAPLWDAKETDEKAIMQKLRRHRARYDL